MSEVVRVGIMAEERCPDYRLMDEANARVDDAVVDVAPSTLTRWRSVAADYQRVQDEMHALVREAQIGALGE